MSCLLAQGGGLTFAFVRDRIWRMSKQLIFIDDSGDPGLTGSGSSNFIIASVVLVGKENRDNLAQAINKYKKGLGWKEREELKFHKTHKKTEWYLVLSGKLPSGSGSVPFKRILIVTRLLLKSNKS